MSATFAELARALPDLYELRGWGRRHARGYTTRWHAYQAECMRCGAVPGELCRGRRGETREHCHYERHLAAQWRSAYRLPHPLCGQEISDYARSQDVEGDVAELMIRALLDEALTPGEQWKITVGLMAPHHRRRPTCR